MSWLQSGHRGIHFSTWWGFQHARLHDIFNTDQFQLRTFFKKCLNERKSRGREADRTCTLSSMGRVCQRGMASPRRLQTHQSSNQTTKRACSTATRPMVWKGLDSSPFVGCPLGGAFSNQPGYPTSPLDSAANTSGEGF